MRVLIIEDEHRLADIIGRVLKQEHFDVDIAHDGLAGLERALTLPGIDGIKLLQELRGARCGTPALMLTARSGMPERVEGLEAGADDYLGKPFAFEELLARLRALLRRRERPLVDDQISVAGLRLNQRDETVSNDRMTIKLSHLEFVMLETLARHQGITITRDQLLERVWGYDADPAGNVVELYIHYVRRKLASLDPAGARLITTVRGVGYRLEKG
jgi:DNA-binding response OmpR family regulator